MSTDTPLTDALMDRIGYVDTFNEVLNHARQMERERAALVGALEMMIDGARMLMSHVDTENWHMDGEVRAAQELLSRCGR